MVEIDICGVKCKKNLFFFVFNSDNNLNESETKLKGVLDSCADIVSVSTISEHSYDSKASTDSESDNDSAECSINPKTDVFPNVIPSANIAPTEAHSNIH